MCFSQDKQQTPKTNICHFRHSLSPDLRGQLKLFLWFASGGLAERKPVTLAAVRDKRRRKREDERRGGAMSIGEISAERSSAEKRRVELEMSEKEKRGGQSEAVPTEVSYSDCLINCQCEE